MRTAIAIGLGTALLAALPAQAAVPFHQQRRSELHRIIDLPALAPLGPIDRIERISAYAWRVTLGRCTVEVHMIERRLRSGMPGYGRTPPTWEPRAQPPVCRRN